MCSKPRFSLVEFVFALSNSLIAFLLYLLLFFLLTPCNSTNKKKTKQTKKTKKENRNFQHRQEPDAGYFNVFRLLCLILCGGRRLRGRPALPVSFTVIFLEAAHCYVMKLAQWKSSPFNCNIIISLFFLDLWNTFNRCALGLIFSTVPLVSGARPRSTSWPATHFQGTWPFWTRGLNVAPRGKNKKTYKGLRCRYLNHVLEAMSRFGSQCEKQSPTFLSFLLFFNRRENSISKYLNVYKSTHAGHILGLVLH